ncbi:hypothetical protein [Rhizobium gallicum]|uniref:hypothetical protein n=1 Tax=Rhizobium gallicum TaxID=56730 RepID=UPI001EF9A910|nr:hypothetical protein [Rhizobium gallicum]ULJ76459.1 hypothetical protein L2W42_29205 [Rhizobium gallicum]
MRMHDGKLEAGIDDLFAGASTGGELAFAPDGALRINLGSSCNVRFESSDEKAADLRLHLVATRRGRSVKHAAPPR